MKKYNYTFDPQGGYDMMTSAYCVFFEDDFLFEIDNNKRGEDEENKKLAEKIVNLLNKSLEEETPSGGRDK